jgi:hypothetical protein
MRDYKDILTLLIGGVIFIAFVSLFIFCAKYIIV